MKHYCWLHSVNLGHISWFLARNIRPLGSPKCRHWILPWIIVQMGTRQVLHWEHQINKKIQKRLLIKSVIFFEFCFFSMELFSVLHIFWCIVATLWIHASSTIHRCAPSVFHVTLRLLLCHLVENRLILNCLTIGCA